MAVPWTWIPPVTHARLKAPVSYGRRARGARYVRVFVVHLPAAVVALVIEITLLARIDSRPVNDELFDIRGKTALVTGGTSGIGLMLAQALVKRAVKTYITGRDLAAGEEVAARLAQHGQCIALAADLADPDGPARWRRRVCPPRIRAAYPGEQRRGWRARRDRCTAGGGLGHGAGREPARTLLPRAAAAAAAARRRAPGRSARIINIGSIGGAHVPNWEAFAYGASKAGLHHLTRALAKRLGREHILANAIAPGPFPSRLTDTDSESVKKASRPTCHWAARAKRADMEGLIVFLAARASRYVNGLTIRWMAAISRRCRQSHDHDLRHPRASDFRRLGTLPATAFCGRTARAPAHRLHRHGRSADRDDGPAAGGDSLRGAAGPSVRP